MNEIILFSGYTQQINSATGLAMDDHNIWESLGNGGLSWYRESTTARYLVPKSFREVQSRAWKTRSYNQR